MIKFKKRVLLYLIATAVFIFGILVVIDAQRISNIEFYKLSDTEYEAKVRGEKYTVKYVPKQNLAPFFGKARHEFSNKFALVRNDLPPRVQSFVTYHELYHLYDFDHGLHKGKISQEVHANLAAFPYEPCGFLHTVFLTLTDPDRLRYYTKLIF